MSTGKNNWLRGNRFALSTVNRPSFVQSGAYHIEPRYNTSGDLLPAYLQLSVSPGSIRNPFKNLTTRFAGDRIFTLYSPKPRSTYTIFQRANGDLVASGHTPVRTAGLKDSIEATPCSPFADGEPIGIIYTGAGSLKTSKLVGPWNTAPSGLHDTRGDYAAATPLRHRLVASGAWWRQWDAPASGGAVLKSNVTLNRWSMQVYEPPLSTSFVAASITYMPSGRIDYKAGVAPRIGSNWCLASGTAVHYVDGLVFRGDSLDIVTEAGNIFTEIVNGGANLPKVAGRARRRKEYLSNQDPDERSRVLETEGQKSPETLTILSSANDSAGIDGRIAYYHFWVFNTANMRISDVSFNVIPGFIQKGNTEK